MLQETKSNVDSLGQEIEEHQDEISSLNTRYLEALSTKASAYSELVESVKELIKRHDRFFSSELGLV